MISKKIVKTVAVASLVAISSINLIGCTESGSEAVSIQVEQDATGGNGQKINEKEQTTKGGKTKQDAEITQIGKTTGQYNTKDGKTSSVGKTSDFENKKQESEVAGVRVGTDTSKTEQKNSEIMAQFDKIPAELIKEPKTPKQEDAVKQDGNQSSGQVVKGKQDGNQSSGQVVKGSDKNGHPYLQPGAEYTFGTDGMPIEAPIPGTYDITLAPVITNPQTGKEYQYWESKGGRWVDYGQVKADMEAEDEWERKVRDGEMTADGRTDLRKMTDEEKAQIAAAMARAMRGE